MNQSRLRRLATMIGVTALAAGGALVVTAAPATAADPVLLFSSEIVGFSANAATVPAGICAVTITADGGDGEIRDLGSPGGNAAVVTARVAVTPGQQLGVQVGGAGGDGVQGFGGAGGGGGGYGGGGGASVVSVGAVPLVVAGGGGGGGSSGDGLANPARGGDGGLLGASGGTGTGVGFLLGHGGLADGDGGAGFAGGGGVGAGGMGFFPINEQGFSGHNDGGGGADGVGGGGAGGTSGLLAVGGQAKGPGQTGAGGADSASGVGGAGNDSGGNGGLGGGGGGGIGFGGGGGGNGDSGGGGGGGYGGGGSGAANPDFGGAGGGGGSSFVVPGATNVSSAPSARRPIPVDGQVTITYDPDTDSCPADETPPTVTITTPPDGATYTQGQVVNAEFECSDLDSGIATCVGEVADGAALDTSTLGSDLFTVNASDNAGNTASSTHAYTVVAAVAPPGAPTDVKAGASASGTANVRFSPPADTGTGQITGYEAVCGAKSKQGTSSPLAVTGLSNGVATTCKVRAKNAAAGFGPFSAEVPFIPGVPWGPTSVTGGPGPVTGSVVVNWNAAQTNGAPIQSYTATCVPWSPSFPTRTVIVGGAKRSAAQQSRRRSAAHVRAVRREQSGTGQPAGGHTDRHHPAEELRTLFVCSRRCRWA